MIATQPACALATQLQQHLHQARVQAQYHSMAKLIILYGSSEGQTAKIAEHIARQISMHGHTVAIMPVETKPAKLKLDEFSVVIIGASIHIGQHQTSVCQFVTAHLNDLQRIPSAFFSVSLTARRTDARGKAVVAQYLEYFQQKTGWRPGRIECFAGALLFSRYSWLKTQMMRVISKMTGGETDTTQDYEYTDWQAVERFADDCLGMIKPAD